MAQLLASNLQTQYTDNVAYSSSANVLALQQGQYTTIGILTQCERTGTATRPVHNDWDTHPVRTYWHCNKDSTQRGILTQCEHTGTATRTVHNDWDTHPVRTYWHCNKDSTQRLGYSPSANVLALQQGQYTTIGILTQCERTGTATRPLYTAIGILTQCERTGTATRPASTQRGILTKCERTGTTTRPVYTAIGRMVAAMLLQGAGMPPIFSHLFIQYCPYGCKLQEIYVASLDLQTILDRVKNDDIRVVQLDDEVVTLVASAGMTCQLTQRNRAEVARPLALQASPVTM